MFYLIGVFRLFIRRMEAKEISRNDIDTIAKDNPVKLPVSELCARIAYMEETIL
jgi:hypothetical protein